MRSPHAEHRLELATALRAARFDPFRLDRGKLRFSLGVSAADLKVPFHVSNELSQLVLQAARQLIPLLVTRHRGLLSRDVSDPLTLSTDFARPPAVSETLCATAGGSDVKATVDLALTAHPLLTGGVVSAWLGPGGGGRSLVALVTEVLRRAIDEMKLHRNQEDTPAIVALALSSLFPSAEAALRQVTLGPPLDRAFRSAAGAALYLAVRLGAERAFRDAQLPSETVLRVEAALGPTVLMGGRPGLAGAGATMYGCDLSAGIPQFDPLLAQLAAEGPSPVETALFHLAGEDPELGRRAETAAAHANYRDLLLRLCLMGEQGALARELTVALRELFVRPGALAATLDDPKLRKETAKQLLDLPAKTADAGALLTRLADALKRHSPKEPAAALGLSRPKAHGEYARAATACLCDFWIEKSLQPARRALLARTGAETEGGLEAQYEAGQLYLVSLGELPVLKSTTQAPLAHLFVDLKDFTRRTTQLGQAAMADFLRREFYVPILLAAKKHFGGARHLADRGGMSLNNLLGDAASLSGSVEAAVTLASDILRHLAAFERRLQSQLSTGEVEQAVRRIEEDFGRKGRDPQADPAKLAVAKAEAIARARGEGLEAGVFVSFGAAPLVITIDDDAFGRSKVAIADKINESARGTARAQGARARVDALLADERVRRKNPKLPHAWRVFVGAPISFGLPPELEEPIRGAVRSGNTETALNLLQAQVRAWLEEAAAAPGAGAGDIYNAGAALSEETLAAYQESMAGRRLFQKLELLPESLAPEIRERFFFPPGLIRLEVGFSPQGQICEVFHYAGKAMFKGLEKSGGIGVWELLSEGPLFELFRHHHAQAWFRGSW